LRARRRRRRLQPPRAACRPPPRPRCRECCNRPGQTKRKRFGPGKLRRNSGGQRWGQRPVGVAVESPTAAADASGASGEANGLARPLRLRARTELRCDERREGGDQQARVPGKQRRHADAEGSAHAGRALTHLMTHAVEVWCRTARPPSTQRCRTRWAARVQHVHTCTRVEKGLGQRGWIQICAGHAQEALKGAAGHDGW
jgi:hypothetical protein